MRFACHLLEQNPQLCFAGTCHTLNSDKEHLLKQLAVLVILPQIPGFRTAIILAL